MAGVPGGGGRAPRGDIRVPVSDLSGPRMEALPHLSHLAGSLDPFVLAKWRLCPRYLLTLPGRTRVLWTQGRRCQQATIV